MTRNARAFLMGLMTAVIFSMIVTQCSAVSQPPTRKVHYTYPKGSYCVWR